METPEGLRRAVKYLNQCQRRKEFTFETYVKAWRMAGRDHTADEIREIGEDQAALFRKGLIEAGCPGINDPDVTEFIHRTINETIRGVFEEMLALKAYQEKPWWKFWK